jgi:hypothetical protein
MRPFQEGTEKTVSVTATVNDRVLHGGAGTFTRSERSERAESQVRVAAVPSNGEGGAELFCALFGSIAVAQPSIGEAGDEQTRRMKDGGRAVSGTRAAVPSQKVVEAWLRPQQLSRQTGPLFDAHRDDCRGRKGQGTMARAVRPRTGSERCGRRRRPPREVGARMRGQCAMVAVRAHEDIVTATGPRCRRRSQHAQQERRERSRREPNQTASDGELHAVPN